MNLMILSTLTKQALVVLIIAFFLFSFEVQVPSYFDTMLRLLP